MDLMECLVSYNNTFYLIRLLVSYLMETRKTDLTKKKNVVTKKKNCMVKNGSSEQIFKILVLKVL
jgi:hypothetical protein